MDILSVAVLLACIINIITAVFMLFIDKKEVTVTLSWLLVFLFLPFFGFLLYFFLGSTAKYRLFFGKKIPTVPESVYRDFLKENIKFIEAEKLPFSKNELQFCSDIAMLNARNAESIYTGDNNVILLTSAEEKYRLMYREISEATESINILYFIIKTDNESGRELINLLAKKAKEGVSVRLIYDRLGYLPARRKDYAELTAAGGKVLTFLPTLIGSVLGANYRMHRKMVIIDGKIAYTGGINIGDDYLGKKPSVSPWRDTAIRITGSAVQTIQLRFFADWNYLEFLKNRKISDEFQDPKNIVKYFKAPEITGETGIQIISCGPDRKYALIKDSYIKLLLTARRYVYIQTPYLAPDETLLCALRIAAAGGVDVRIMIPGVPDKKFVYHTTMSYVGDLLGYGIKIYRYSGFLHAKTLVTDDLISVIGSANFDIRSFSLNFEMSSVIYDKPFAETCRNTFFEDMKSCKEITHEEYENRSFTDKLKESFWRLITPLV